MPTVIRLAHAPLVGALVLLAACGRRDETATRTSDTLSLRIDSAGAANAAMAARGTLDEANTAAQLDSVADAARTGITALAPAVAVPLIRSLEEKLDASEDSVLDDIADDLEALRAELDRPKLAGAKIAAIFDRLGPKVQQVAARGGPAQRPLETIARSLTTAVPTLRGRKR